MSNLVSNAFVLYAGKRELDIKINHHHIKCDFEPSLSERRSIVIHLVTKTFHRQSFETVRPLEVQLRLNNQPTIQT